MAEKAHAHIVRDLKELPGLVGKVVMYSSKGECFNTKALYQGLTDEGSPRHIFATRGKGRVLVSLASNDEIKLNPETGSLVDYGEDLKMYGESSHFYHFVDHALREVGL